MSHSRPHIAMAKSDKSTPCENCMKKAKKHAQDPGKPKRCGAHQCQAAGERCNERKKTKENLCPRHKLEHRQDSFSSCVFHGCPSKAIDSSHYCSIHACPIRGCQRGAQPGHGKDFCEDHKCEDIDCQLPKRPIGDPSFISYAKFCYTHECFKHGCELKRLSEKRFCLTHACTVQGCQTERDAALTVCLEHHDKDVRKSAAERFRQDWEQEQVERARKENEAAAERAKIRQQVAQELEEKQKEEVERRVREESERRERNRNTSARSSGTIFGTSASTNGVRTPRSSGEFVTGDQFHGHLPTRSGSQRYREEQVRSSVGQDGYLRPEQTHIPRPTAHCADYRPTNEPKMGQGREWQAQSTTSTVRDEYPREDARASASSYGSASRPANAYSNSQPRQDFDVPRRTGRAEHQYEPQQRTASREVPVDHDQYRRPIEQEVQGSEARFGEPAGRWYASRVEEPNGYGTYDTKYHRRI